MKKQIDILFGLAFVLFIVSNTVSAQQTDIVYLSGTDAFNTKTWDFECSAGRKSGELHKIEVPSCWEQQGFGEYIYGRGVADFEERLKESGTYYHSFDVPAEWKSKHINIVFEGVMTDALVKVNGILAGAKHQGAFCQFKYDISHLLKYGEKNSLVVEVDKFSSNESVNYAEREADFWVFGGIYRPVYLEVLPSEHIKRVEIDARADGTLNTAVALSGAKNVKMVSVDVINREGVTIASFSETVSRKQNRVLVTGNVENPELWTAEHPNLYTIKYDLKDKHGKVIHTLSYKAGFRTIEVKANDGIYVNGVKIKLKGVNRHTFHPEFGRTSSKSLSIVDVNYIKDLNMNAVRMSHYPPEQHFLDVCDSLGLFVVDELTGWQSAYDSIVGKKLLTSMIHRDMNHPSIILWSNGNEGGWNTSYDDDFQKLDIQKREVLHPWQDFGKFNTNHYIKYSYLGGFDFVPRKIFMPTEFLHGLYDGGHGAGLEDFWQKMYNDPLCAGGFLWSYADECLLRSDTKVLDCVGNRAPDGILGPYLEKEGSYFTVKKIWSPIVFEKKYITPDFNGMFNLENRFYFTNLNECTLKYKWTKLPSNGEEEMVLMEGVVQSPDIAPQNKGTLQIDVVKDWQKADILTIEAFDRFGRQINVWTWPVQTAEDYANSQININNRESATLIESDDFYTFRSGDFYIEFSKKDGTLNKVGNSNGEFPIHNGPVLMNLNILPESVDVWKEGNAYVVSAGYKDGMMNFQWSVYADGIVDLDIQYQLPKGDYAYAGINFGYPEDEIKGVTYIGNGPYRVWKNRMSGPQFGRWIKTYNNSITGYSGFEYPEFKGFYSECYKVEFKNKSKGDFSVFCKTNDIFFRLFTPEQGVDPIGNTMEFPAGDISFMHGILPIGTKPHVPEELGPQSATYYYDSSRMEKGCLYMSLTFDFSGSEDF